MVNHHDQPANLTCDGLSIRDENAHVLGAVLVVTGHGPGQRVENRYADLVLPCDRRNVAGVGTVRIAQVDRLGQHLEPVADFTVRVVKLPGCHPEAEPSRPLGRNIKHVRASGGPTGVGDTGRQRQPYVERYERLAVA